MKQDRSLRTLLQAHWLSWALLVIAYTTFGGFLHHLKATPATWVLMSFVAIGGTWLITLGWPQARRVILIGFQSDMGYFVMALILASLAVVAVNQFQMFAYFSMLLAVSLLARVDNLVAGFKDAVAFVWLSGLALLGLALSWLPVLLESAVHDLHP